MVMNVETLFWCMELKRATVVFPSSRRSALGRATQSEEIGSRKSISEFWMIALRDTFLFSICMKGGIGKVREKTVWSSSQPAVAALAPSPAFPRPSPPPASPLLPAAEPPAEMETE